MPRRTESATGGATKPRQFRFTDAELAAIDRLVESLQTDPNIPVSRTAVLRIAVREMTERRFKNGKGQSRR